jgi:hypothetical protein
MVLPPVSVGIDKLTGFVHTAIGIFDDMKKAADFTMVGGGDFLGSLIGPKAAADFMGAIRTISAEWQSLWFLKIQPAIHWAEQNVPKFWEAFKTAIGNFWSIAKPKLDDLAKVVGDIKEKFDKLPPSVQHWAEATAAGVVIVKATGLDDVIQGWANALGNFAGGAAGAITLIRGASIAAGVAAAGFLILSAAIGAVIYVGTHLDDLEASWTMLSLLFKLEFAKTADAIVNLFNFVVRSIEGNINAAIESINLLIEGINNIPGMNVPKIARIHIDLPNANNVENALNEIARNRTANIYTNVTDAPRFWGGAHPQAAGGDWFVTKPTLFVAGDAGPERATFTPMGAAARGQGSVDRPIVIQVPVQINSREVAYAQANWDNDQARRFGIGVNG